MIDLAEVLKVEGLDVVEIDGWKDRRRPGRFTPAGVIFHHTAGARGSDAPSLPVVVNGRERLPGPLCNVLIGRSGSVYLVSNGRANDSGIGVQAVLERVRRDLAPLGDAGVAGDFNGNPFFYDVEVENDGRGESYPAVQLEAAVKVGAAICRAAGWSANRCIHHREWTGRKIDMSWRGDLRGLVAARMENTQEVTLPNHTIAHIPRGAGELFIIPGGAGGYRILTEAGGCYDFGCTHIGAPDAVDDPEDPARSRLSDAFATPSGNGYVAVYHDGRVFAFGDAAYHGGAVRTG